MNFFIGYRKYIWQSGQWKCLFNSNTLEFLDHLFGGNCITINEENQEKIRQAKRLTTKKEIRLFLGLTNQYRDYNSSVLAIAALLSNRTRKRLPKRVHWNDYCRRLSWLYTEKLLRRSVLRLPVHTKPFVLRTNVSNCD